MEEFLKQLGIEKKLVKNDNNTGVMELKDSDEFGYIDSQLSNSKLVKLDEESSVITYESEVLQYDSKDYLITLIGDFEKESYRLTMKEK